jgi:hypothetical protein
MKAIGLGRPVVLLALWGLAAGPACGGGGGDDGDAADVGEAEAEAEDAFDGDRDGEADAEPDDGSEADAPDDACVPATCGDFAAPCGTYDDGCGGTITCTGGCACREDTWRTDCPERPCEVSSGCADGVCEYEPVICGDVACACRTGSCSDEDLRSCGDVVCADRFCDPSPYRERGVLRFRNECLDTAEAPCGLCDLGLRTCSRGAFVCHDVEIPGLDTSRVECDSALAGSTFVYLDVGYAGGRADGSRDRPFPTWAAALAAALARNARGIVIGGTPVFTDPLVVSDGVSVLGGYEPWPSWVRDDTYRPTWRVGAERAADGRLVGALAEGITLPTALVNVNVRTADATPAAVGAAGTTNYGIAVRRSSALSLIRVRAEPGEGGAGGTGRPGTDGPPGTPGLRGGTSVCSVDSGTCTSFTARSALGGAEVPSASCPAGVDPAGSGGAGGDSTYFSPFRIEGFAGQPGEGDGGGAGGAAGNLSSYTSGRPGGVGAAASAAPPAQGAHATPAGGVVLGWLDLRGIGELGMGGAGGAGGGGGGGGDGSVSFASPVSCSTGAGGGSGGAGGCGGGGGNGGLPGGWSVGLFVADSTGLRLRESEFHGGAGGDGGAGGLGGGGGYGGAGGYGGTVTPGSSTCAACSSDRCWGALQGGMGGRGGAGQPGGQGGVGAGGSSVGAYCSGAAVLIEGFTTFRAGTPGLGGPAGEGHPGEAIERVECGS